MEVCSSLRDKTFIPLTSHSILKCLCTGLFHHLWERKDLLQKIHVMEGDILLEDLGLHPLDKEELLDKTHFVIHSAAAVALDDPIKETLTNNYFSTSRLLKLCQKMPYLRSYAHVSTAYVSINSEPGSVVEEKVFQLKHGDQVWISQSPLLLSIFRQTFPRFNGWFGPCMIKWKSLIILVRYKNAYHAVD